MNANKTLISLLVSVSANDDLNPEDKPALGLYEVKVPADQPECIQVGIAKDYLHSYVAIGDLEGVDVSVYRQPTASDTSMVDVKTGIEDQSLSLVEIFEADEYLCGSHGEGSDKVVSVVGYYSE